ncbi:MAG: helicase-exonuclease AddAB subunit AddA [Lachnospiraceae bacterium]|nr:helicase-exonuclease AddAB subunit AddA [Lachnospiraceae bacterium]
MRAWSDEQKLAIDLRKRELLVSAAAGSGKTTVLVERLIKWVTEKGPDGEGPADIDQFLVVTFTKAAAAEMRTRLYSRLMKEAENAADSDKTLARHIRKQLTLIGQAHVQTIDAFASFVLRNYFHEIDLDPAFRIGEQGELALMRQDAIATLLEEEYQKGTPGFLHCMEYFTPNAKNDDLSKLLLKLYDYSQSAADPEKWLESLSAPYKINTKEELDQADWNRWLYHFVLDLLGGMRNDVDEAIAMCARPDGSARLSEILSGVRDKIQDAMGAERYDQFYLRINALTTPAVSYTKKETEAKTSVPLFNEIKRIAGRVYKMTEDLQNIFQYPAEKVLSDLHTASKAVEELADLIRAFGNKFTEMKREHNLIDFSDAEHLALKVLRDENGARTETAKDLAGKFKEILIDEYQDSNNLQEELLGAVSTDGPNGRNIFMVGDKKQSIYRFRRANPDLFIDKFHAFDKAREEASGIGQTVELNANYRSRKEVTDTVNSWFRLLMRETVGGIDYDEREELIPKGTFIEEEKPLDRQTEFLLADLKEADDDPSSGGDNELSALEAQAHVIASEIRKLVDNGFPVQERGRDDTLRFRKVRYQDIVILIKDRNGGILETFTDIFAAYGVPCHADATAGFYETLEIRYVMDLLRVLTNPIDDASFVSVLKNPLSGFTNDDLAAVFSAAGKGDPADGPYKFANGFFGRVRKYVTEKPAEDPLRKKLCDQLERIEHFRKLSAEMPLSGFIRMLYRETGLNSFVAAMNNGKRRLANLEQLIERAREFENTSYAGLFNFIRYIEKKAQTEVEEGEANVETEKDDVVRIMTMHGSKGLEFPIVFLPKMEQRCKTDGGTVSTNSRLGIGIHATDLKRREQYDTYYENVLKARNKVEARGEELRVLYVAMTRAREKLYLTAALQDLEKTLGAYEVHFESGAVRLSTSTILSASTLIDWLLEATDNDTPVRMRRIPRSEILNGYVAKSGQRDYSKEQLADAFGAPVSPASSLEVDRVISARYLRDDLSKIPASVTVSRLKAAAQEQAEEEQEEERTRPVYVADDKTPERITGSARGTLYHLVMERMDPHKDAESEVARLTAVGLTSKEEQATIKLAQIDAFWASSLGKRFIKAYDRGQGFREKQFILALPVREIPELFPDDLAVDPGETVMIQGVIDLYFEEEDGLVLLDYKTDVVNEPQELVRRYATQLRYYRKALEAVTGKTVKESYIWSFRLGKLISV